MMQAVSVQRVLHIAPGDSAGGSLRQALAHAGRNDAVLAFRDDLSCGPIAWDDPVMRAEWWGFEEGGLVWNSLTAFWTAVETTSDRLVVWFSRHSARELAFFLSWCNRLGDRPYDVVDVTGRCLPYLDRNGQPKTAAPLVAVGITPTEALSALFGTERALTEEERCTFCAAWRRLKSEDAHFRIVTEAGMVSVPEDHFDACLLGCASAQWQKVARVIGGALYRTGEPFIQVDCIALHDRLIGLVERGDLLADGDPSEMQRCSIRLPV